MIVKVPEFFNRYAKMIREGKKIGPTVIELHEDDGVHWGVSIGGSNPEPEDYYECRSSQEAFNLKAKIEREAS